MPEPIYFQWQNPHLLRTIYPLREMKLRDFLVFYHEIDVWQQYKDKTLKELGGEVQAHKSAQRDLISNAYDRYKELKVYFEKADVSDEFRLKFPDLDPGFMEKINRMHRDFNRYFPTYNNIVKEKYFLSRQISLMESYRKDIDREIADKQRIVRNMGPGWKKTPEYQGQIERLTQVTNPMASQELENLQAFLSAFVKVEKRRKDIIGWKTKNEQAKTGMAGRLDQLSKEKGALEAKIGEIETDLARLKAPPDPKSLETYFTKEDVSADYQQKFLIPDRNFIEKLNEIHRSIKSYYRSHPNFQQRILFLQARMRDLESYRREIDKDIAEKERIVRNMGESWSKTPKYRQEIQTLRNVTLAMVRAELNKMEEFLAAMEISGKSAEEIKAAIQENEGQRSQLESQLSKIIETLDSLEKQFNKVEEVLHRSEKEQLMAFVDSHELGVRDIVRGKVEVYQNTLAQLDHEALLEEIVNRFLANPGRYPLWLQYMVIHFSGMRYKSAHGSWADPKDLLFSLNVRDIEKSFKVKDDDTIEALIEERITDYQTEFVPMVSGAGVDGPVFRKPKLAMAKEGQWKEKVEYHLNRLEKAKYPTQKRKALLDLLIDEESYEIETLSDQEALQLLEGKKSELPSWMWNEIVRLTDLRKNEVKDENWEELSADDLLARQAYEAREYREILDKWKRENLTGWREEHDRANRLIVTRAVCNEVAEHIQHLRGNTPGGGLTAKPEWYLRKEKDPKLAERADRPYFTKPHIQADFKEGASILWLRYVNSMPSPWQIAHPIRLKNGEGLISAMTRKVRGDQKSKGDTEAKSAGKARRKSGGQWLRWIHEATVAEAGSTADGPVVLTFETALPYEDRRQSTIGVFKHSAPNLYHNSAVGSLTFVGYAPRGDVPYEDLKEMMDWNKILRKRVLSDAQMKAYWDKAIQIDQEPAHKPEEGTFPGKSPGAGLERRSSLVEVAPALNRSLHKERIVCFELDPATKRAKVYQPRVELRRGLKLWVASREAVKVGAQTYLPVERCDGEPRAQELYVRANEIIESPEDRSSGPVESKEKLNLRRITGANKSGKPILEIASVRIPAGTKLRISTVHKVTPGDPGNGVIDADGPDDYYLIVECPSKVSAEGLFLRTKDVIKISEEAYGSRQLKPAKQDSPPSFVVEQVRFSVDFEE